MSPSERRSVSKLLAAIAHVAAPMVIVALLAPPPALGDKQSKAALIDELLVLSNARGGYTNTLHTLMDQARLTSKLQRNLIERQLQPAHPLDDPQNAKKKELDAVLDGFEASVNEMMAKATAWDSIKPLVVAAYDGLFSEEELAGIVAFYKTPIGQVYARKMPEFVTRTGQLGKDAGLALKPEIISLTQQTLAKAILLGYVLPPTPSAGVPGGIPGGTAGGVIGGIIGSIPTMAPPPPPPPDGSAMAPHPERIRVGGNVQQAKLIQQAKPVYPPLARQARVSGVVKLNAIIGKDGTVQNLTVASGHPILVPAAMDAVKQWVYQPTVINGEPVMVVTQIDVNFMLGGTDAPAPAQRQALASDSLVKVVEMGDLATLQARLSSGANPNEPDDSVVKGWTPLMAAADAGNVDAARLLLDAGAAIDAKTELGSTALDIAIRGGKQQVADLLRGRGATNRKGN